MHMKTEEITLLGKNTGYIQNYAPDLLEALPRSRGRDEINLSPDNLPFAGFDLWTGFELSWLNDKGKPVVAIAEFFIPACSSNLIESKSFKLYLNSFNQTRFASEARVISTLENDLSSAAAGNVKVKLYSQPDDYPAMITLAPGECIDHLDIEVNDYQFNPDYLRHSVADETVSETLVSHLLKSNCLVTNQPDWGSVIIRYKGKKINRESLLRYIISFRTHNEFHEQCVERIFSDISHYCNPEKLTVFARYTRRGGLDINPFRSNFEESLPAGRLIRQ
ncbi:NADPH-dependent 7-cyano-7-deazaguanine reductase QueF [Erwinia sp. OLTSP20]|uniref:NADPH-dependent 7-cyano-7-deazaguanine reductase QueF n=1 Tax=unclassified Erwinia TaxID=2622719 RepID=UPI000C191858|nr:MULTISPECIES: NADPH-dependent 7-cyano-7-deazaguanine reductase QueF [unclassified Erwinia]PIJ48600.1 NADPH-dependent 7-cyano-7-deazaguanine reductase QueF [Erwinia sp. OAMSP11]PIJ68954.1 NADPH-dependent 7-cyano-7-deazaguanine reductase QueF [Erwinia sp. OLSSP12]PIJ78832.1 NADPH-dependent 7-cyano-7-deazaguanine reductase QueF [Erwinia sp. OLCASP19]PIJ79918.1 NADPH-dependent 7-cyano-7-deazaguanine reductase QueF [Erwinia sp. OLMTSP26]PIJ82036.1 NADPH-dependent 7-cyano-7-deazaguanine reductase